MTEQTPHDDVRAGEPQIHAHSEHAVPAHAPAASAFSDADWNYFRAEDFAAGKAVVLLMVGIFSTGVILYSIVAATVMP